MAILADDGVAEVAAQALADADGVEGPAAGYARALAAVATGAAPDTSEMLAAGDAFARTGQGAAGAADGDADGYRAALGEIMADFEARDQHLSGVAVADTAMVLERLAEPRGMAVHPVERAAAAGRLIRGEGAAGLDILRRLGAIAQLGERRAGSAKVTGSSPVSSIPAKAASLRGSRR